MNKSLKIFAIFVFMVVTLSGCTLNQGTNTTNPTENPQNEAPTKAEEPNAEVKVEVGVGADEEYDTVIVGKNFTFEPALIEAKPGETIRVLFDNQEGFHDLVIDELGVATKQLQAGGKEVIEITVPEDTKSGTEYEFYCSVGKHRQMGMVGVFRVL